MKGMARASNGLPQVLNQSMITPVIEDILKENDPQLAAILPSQVGLGSCVPGVTDEDLKAIYESIKRIGWAPDEYPLVTYNPDAREEGQPLYLCLDGMQRIAALLRLQSEGDDRFIGKSIMMRLVPALKKRDMLLIASVRNYCPRLTTERACRSTQPLSSYQLRKIKGVRKIRRTPRRKCEAVSNKITKTEDDEGESNIVFPKFEEVPSKVLLQAHDSKFPALCPYPSKIREAVSKKTLESITCEVRKCFPSSPLDEARQRGYNQASLLHCGYIVLSDIISASSHLAEDLKQYLSFLEAMFVGKKHHPLARDFWEPIFNAKEGRKRVPPGADNLKGRNNRYQTTGRSASRLEETFPEQFQRKLRIDLFLSQFLGNSCLLGEKGKHRINYNGGRALATMYPCAAQQPHVDYKFRSERHKTPSYFAMVSGKRGFSIYVWRGSHRAGIIRGSDKYIAELQKSWPCEKVEVPPFSVVLIRGDLVHAGAESAHDESLNIRLHYYLPYIGEEVEDLTELCPLFRFNMEN